MGNLKWQHQALGHVLRAQGLLPVPRAPISVPLPLFLGLEDLSGLLPPAGGEAHMQAALGGSPPLILLPTSQKLSAASSWGNDTSHCREGDREVCCADPLKDRRETQDDLYPHPGQRQPPSGDLWPARQPGQLPPVQASQGRSPLSFLAPNGDVHSPPSPLPPPPPLSCPLWSPDLFQISLTGPISSPFPLPIPATPGANAAALSFGVREKPWEAGP